MSQGTKYNSTNVETLAANKTLVATAAKFQILAPAGDRDVTLPDIKNDTNDATSGTGTVGTDLFADHNSGFFYIENTANASEVITVKGWNGTNSTTALGTPGQNEAAICYWTGSAHGWNVNVVANS